MKIITKTLILLLVLTAIAPIGVFAADSAPVTSDTDDYTLSFSSVEEAIPLADPSGQIPGEPMGYVYKLLPGTSISLTAKTEGIFPSISCYDSDNRSISSFPMSAAGTSDKGQAMKVGTSLTYEITEADFNTAYMSLDIKKGENNISYYFVVSKKNEAGDVKVIPKRIVKVTPTNAIVKVNGKVQAFLAYNVNGNNYFKLRDLAAALQNTDKPFDINYDAKTGDISLYSDIPYTLVGGELSPPSGITAEMGIATPSTLYLDDERLNLVSYLIRSNNYYMLRDLGKALDFSVEWIGGSRTILIDTSQPYTEEK